MFWEKRVRRNDKYINVINYMFLGEICCDNIRSDETGIYWECVGIWKKKNSKKTVFN